MMDSPPVFERSSGFCLLNHDGTQTVYYRESSLILCCACDVGGGWWRREWCGYDASIYFTEI